MKLPAVMPPFTTKPETLLKIGDGGYKEETPNCLKLNAILSGVISDISIFNFSL